MSDREKAGFHGPVRTCVEETPLPDAKSHSTTTEYDSDGRLLRFALPIRTAQGEHDTVDNHGWCTV
jgi:hypothetical protein